MHRVYRVKTRSHRLTRATANTYWRTVVSRPCQVQESTPTRNAYLVHLNATNTQIAPYIRVRTVHYLYILRVHPEREKKYSSVEKRVHTTRYVQPQLLRLSHYQLPILRGVGGAPANGGTRQWEQGSLNGDAAFKGAWSRPKVPRCWRGVAKEGGMKPNGPYRSTIGELPPAWLLGRRNTVQVFAIAGAVLVYTATQKTRTTSDGML